MAWYVLGASYWDVTNVFSVTQLAVSDCWDCNSRPPPRAIGSLVQDANLYLILCWESLRMYHVSIRSAYLITSLILKVIWFISSISLSTSYFTELFKEFKTVMSASISGRALLWCVYHMLLTSTPFSIHEIGWQCIYLSLDRVVTRFWVIVFPKSFSRG